MPEQISNEDNTLTLFDYLGKGELTIDDLTKIIADPNTNHIKVLSFVEPGALQVFLEQELITAEDMGRIEKLKTLRSRSGRFISYRE